MDMRGAGLAVVGFCLLTAGCAGLFGSDAATTEPVTPVPVPTADSTTTPERRAPGVVGDPTALAHAHVRALSNTSYRVRHSTTVRNNSGIQWREQTRASIAAGYRSYTASRTVTGRPISAREVSTTFRDGRAVRRTTVNGMTTTAVVADSRGIGGPPRPPRAAMFFDPTYNERLITLFTHINSTSIRSGSPVVKQFYGVSLYRVRSTGATGGTAIATRPADRISNVSFSATVMPNGVVRSYALQYTVVNGSESRRVSETLRYSDLGTTTIEFDDDRQQIQPNATGSETSQN